MSKLVFENDEEIEQALAFLEEQQDHVCRVVIKQSQNGVEYDKQPTATETQIIIELDTYYK